MFKPSFALLSLAGSIGSASADIGKSTYAMEDPFAWKDFMEKYFPTYENVVQANSTETCNEWAKLCMRDEQLTPDQCSGPNKNFQMHSVGAYKRVTGNMSMTELETAFSGALGNMSKYDPYMEYHAAYYTAGLADYVSAFAADGIQTFQSEFTDPSSSTTYASVIVQPTTSFSVIELLGHADKLFGDLNSTMAEGNGESLWNPVLRGVEPRAELSQLASVRATGENFLTPLHVSYASSDLARDVDFFENTLLGTKVASTTTADGTQIYQGKFHTDHKVMIQFVQSKQASQGSMQVSDWEDYKNALHKDCIHSPTDGFDRLADNHIGAAMGDNIDQQVKNVAAKGGPYRFYGRSQQPFFYAYMPNGEGVQLIGQCTTCDAGGKYDFCTGGVAGTCKHY